MLIQYPSHRLCGTRLTSLLVGRRSNGIWFAPWTQRLLSAATSHPVPTTKQTATSAPGIPDPRDQRVLHAAVAGLPNAGKSTLLNYLVGDKVSAVSTKRHTTRENTLGVMTVGNAQVFFHDTPGFVSHEERDDYQPALAAASREAIGLVNVTLLVVDASKEVTKRGFRSLVSLLERALLSRCEIFLVLNKTDAVNPKHRLLSTTDTIMDKAQEIMDRLDKEREEAAAGRSSSRDEAGPGGGAEGIRLFRDGGKTVDDHITVFMVSAKTGDGVGDIVDFLVHRSRPGSWLFGRDDTTNKDKRTRVNEIVREGLFKHLYKELPYQMKTETRDLYRRPDNSVSVLQDLRVERDSQKYIVLGKLRYIRKDVEWDLRKVFGTRVDVRFNIIVGIRRGSG